MALYIPHIIFHLTRLLYVRPETFGPYCVFSNLEYTLATALRSVLTSWTAEEICRRLCKRNICRLQGESIWVLSVSVGLKVLHTWQLAVVGTVINRADALPRNVIPTQWLHNTLRFNSNVTAATLAELSRNLPSWYDTQEDKFWRVEVDRTGSGSCPVLKLQVLPSELMPSVSMW